MHYILLKLLDFDSWRYKFYLMIFRHYRLLEWLDFNSQRHQFDWYFKDNISLIEIIKSSKLYITVTAYLTDQPQIMKVYQVYQVTIILTLLSMVWGKHLLIETMDEEYAQEMGEDYGNTNLSNGSNIKIQPRSVGNNHHLLPKNNANTNRNQQKPWGRRFMYLSNS